MFLPLFPHIIIKFLKDYSINSYLYHVASIRGDNIPHKKKLIHKD